MAEYFFKQQFPHLFISSAGISGLTGHPADDKAIHCMDRLNIDMRPHVARKLNADLIKKANLILVMSNNQQVHLEQTWPFAKGKTFRLGHWQNRNVQDPYQHDQAFFDQTCLNIQSYVQDWASHI
ncbi:low molecular weight protein-tyrosine-phosphatase [Acinetobacter puyangensis]|uniref:protein-tyrosine-phosphatase n=2 Tax=Acinetobacter puyangensis TaxID=1096779 RepID=A0A240E700_9GAMM|nr:protein-tyrosine phosphatase [Acinetobacter puyangensis]